MTKWISVKDRLPEKRGDVLISDDIGLAVAHFNSGNFYIEGSKWNKFITHWMPLPLPPEDTDDKV